MRISRILSTLAAVAALASASVACNSGKNMDTVYQFTVQDTEGNQKNLSDYKGKVLLIVNTASRCGFTPQYEELEAMYSELKSKGLEILDQTEFRQFHKIDVNGENEIPLFTWLKAQKGFEGFDAEHKLTPILENMFDANMPGWRETSDIKWNFTKFLVDRKGNVVERFEPTATAEKMLPRIKELL